MKMNKFRVWDVDNGRYLENSEKEEFFIGMDGHLYINEWTGDSCGYEMGVIELPSDMYTVERCTGFSDRNGREIYEGDLLKRGTQKGIAQMFEGRWKVIGELYPTSGMLILGDLFGSKYFKIIGTVHDNDNSSEKANSSEVEGV